MCQEIQRSHSNWAPLTVKILEEMGDQYDEARRCLSNGSEMRGCRGNSLPLRWEGAVPNWSLYGREGVCSRVEWTYLVVLRRVLDLGCCQVFYPSNRNKLGQGVNQTTWETFTRDRLQISNSKIWRGELNKEVLRVQREHHCYGDFLVWDTVQPHSECQHIPLLRTVCMAFVLLGWKQHDEFLLSFISVRGFSDPMIQWESSWIVVGIYSEKTDFETGSPWSYRLKPSV